MFEDLEQVWEIWAYLNICRQVGFSVSPLGVEAIVAGLDLFCIRDVDTRLEYFKLLKTLDTLQLELTSNNATGSQSRPDSKLPEVPAGGKGSSPSRRSTRSKDRKG